MPLVLESPYYPGPLVTQDLIFAKIWIGIGTRFKIPHLHTRVDVK